MSGTTPVSMADLLAASGAARVVSTPPPEPAAEAGHEEPADVEPPQPCPRAAAA